MSEHFAEATVQISPNLKGFKKKLEDDLREVMGNIKPQTVKVGPALTRDFVGDLRKQVNAAILKAQSGIKPIRIKAFIEPVGVARGTAGALTRTGGGGAGSGGATGPTRQAAANQALARSLELVATAQLNLTRAFDESLPVEEQLAAVTKVTTTLDDAQAAAERSLAKAIVQRDAAAKKAATRQLSEIADFRSNIAPRVSQVAALQPATPAAPKAGTKAAIASTRKISEGLKGLVVDLNRTDEAASKLGVSTDDLSAHQELLKQRTQQLTTATNLEKKVLTSENVIVKQAVSNAKARATAAVASSKQQVESIEQVAKAEREAAQQADKLARAQAASQRRAAQAAARSASAEKRRSEQLSRGGQASLLSLAGIRGATLAASRSFLVGAAAITVFARAVKQFADLERNLDVFRATTSATAQQMEQVRKEATALGADLTLPAVSAGDAAGAMVELAKAGLTVQDSIDGARAVLELSTAAAIDNADAVRLVANVLNAFTLSGKDAATVADTLANAANAAQGSIADIGTAFQQAASAGHQVGLSFQDTATFLTILAKNGLRGSDAGTSLRTALIRLVNPSKEAAAQFQKLGIVLRDASGNLRPDVFLQIANATAALGPAQRDATIALIGGQDAFRAVTILGRQSVNSFLAMRAALREEGTAAELAKARTEGLHGAMDGLQSVLETVGTNLAGNLGPGLAHFVRSVSGGITALGESGQVATTLGQTLDSLTLGFNLLGDAMKAVGVVALPLASLLTNVVTSIGVGTILSGVIAYKALNAVLDGAILRLRVLAPLLKVVATARLGASIQNALAAARATQVAITGATNFSAAAGAATGVITKNSGAFAKLSSNATTAGLASAAAAQRVSTFSVALRGLGAGLAALATTGNIALVAVTALAAGTFILLTRQSDSEKAASNLAKTTDALAEAYGRAKIAAQDLAGAQRTADQQQLGISAAVLDRLRAERELRGSDAAAGSVERRQLELNLAIAVQNVTFATQDYNKALKDLKTTQEEVAAASDNQKEAFNDQRNAILRVLAAGASFSDAASGDTTRLISGALKDGFDSARRFLQVQKTLESQSRKNRLSGDAELESLGRRQAALRGLLTAMKETGRQSLKPITITALLKAPNLAQAISDIVNKFKFASREAKDAFIKSIIDNSGLGSAQREALERQLLPFLVQPFTKAIPIVRDKGFELGTAAADGVKEGFKANFSVSDLIDTLTAEGLGDAAILAKLQAKLPGLQKRFNRLDKATKGGTFFKNEAQQKNFEAARDELNAANAEIERLTGDIDQAAKDQQQSIKDAQDKRDQAGQAIVDSILDGRRATLLQRKITSAGLTAWLGDDLKSNQNWLAFLRAQKKIMLARLKAAGASAAVIKSAMKQISDLIFSVTNDIKKINKDISDNVSNLKDVALQKIDLRIRIAQAQDNVAAEIKLRRQKIALLTVEIKKLAAQGKKNTVAWLELVAQRAEEEAALKDLNAKNKDLSNQFKQQFEFLQTLSGFSANLIGNLIPFQSAMNLVNLSGAGKGLGLTGGGVVTGSGGSKANIPGIPGFHDNEGRGPRLPGSSPGRNLSSAATAAQAAQERGITRGQGQTTNHLLRMMLAELHKLTRSQAHPEATHQRNKGAASFDYGYQGPGF